MKNCSFKICVIAILFLELSMPFFVNAEQTPTAEEVAFMEKVFVPLLDSARKNYPAPGIRKELDHLLIRVAKKEIFLNPVAGYNKNKKTVIMATGYTEDGKGSVGLFIPVLMKEYKSMNANLFQDKIVIGVLHEGYHISHKHGVNEINPAYKEYEIHAWWDTCGHIKEMLAFNRLNGLSENDEMMIMWRAFVVAKGDKNSPAWQGAFKENKWLYKE